MRKTRDEAKTAILKVAPKEGRPLLIGEASLMLGAWSLAETEEIIQEMVSEGSIREATPQEARRFGCSWGYYLV